MGRSVNGHWMLIRSEATSMSESESALLSRATVLRVIGLAALICEDSDRNHVEE